MKTQRAAKSQDRAQTQCDRILDAAQQCFIRHGFHAASMASIAAAANMSAGLIYRYFDSKNAIILAIIERQLAIMHDEISALRSDLNLASLFGELFASWQRGSARGMRPALYLELSAASTRDPQIAQAVRKFDHVRLTESCAWLKQVAKANGMDLTDAEVRQSEFALRCFIDGLALHAVRESDLDPAFVAESLKVLLPRLLPFLKPATSVA